MTSVENGESLSHTKTKTNQNTHLNPRAIIIQHFPQLHTITVQCEIPPTQQIYTQCKQCLCTHGPVCEGPRPRPLSMCTGYCTSRVHNILTIINPRTQ